MTQSSRSAAKAAILEGGSCSDPGLCQARFSEQHCPHRQLPSPNHCNPSVAIVGEDRLGDPNLYHTIN